MFQSQMETVAHRAAERVVPLQLPTSRLGYALAWQVCRESMAEPSEVAHRVLHAVEPWLQRPFHLSFDRRQQPDSRAFPAQRRSA